MRALLALTLMACSSVPAVANDSGLSDAGFDSPELRSPEVLSLDLVSPEAHSPEVTARDLLSMDRVTPIDAPSRDAVYDIRADTTTDRSTDRSTDILSEAAVDVSVCPRGMVHLPGFCIDRYEAPNIAGAPPLAMQNATAGAAWCAERGRRLCTEAEWVRACQGAHGLPYPYGTSYVRGRCTDDRTWRSPNWTTLGTWPSAAAMAEAARLYQADPSGSREQCVSDDGVFDLTGNVAEWVARSFTHTNNYDHVMKGCYWAGCYGGSPPSCSFVNPAHPSGFRTYEAGFRCCLTAP